MPLNALKSIEDSKMDEQTALSLAVQKALNNGWTFFDWIDADGFEWSVTYQIGIESHSELLVETETELADYNWHPNIIIFDHGFAKALWGDKFVISRTEGGQTVETQMAYLWHLQQMVISTNPIKYLGENI